MNTKIFNPVWVAKKSYLWGRSLLTLKNSDVILAFYPKTGSTWVRIFLYNLLSNDKEFTFDKVNSIMPEFAHPTFFQEWEFENSPKLIKTHRPYRSIFQNNKVILFGREPRDTMYSYLHYANAKKEFNFSGDLNDLVYHEEMGLEYYMKFYTSWKDRASLFIKYEDMRKNPVETFSKLVAALGIDKSQKEIEEALEKSSLQRTRAAQEKSSEKFTGKFKEGFVFARKGASGEGKKEFDDNLNSLYKNLREKYSFDLYPY